MVQRFRLVQGGLGTVQEWFKDKFACSLEMAQGVHRPGMHRDAEGTV